MPSNIRLLILYPGTRSYWKTCFLHSRRVTLAQGSRVSGVLDMRASVLCSKAYQCLSKLWEGKGGILPRGSLWNGAVLFAKSALPLPSVGNAPTKLVVGSSFPFLPWECKWCPQVNLSGGPPSTLIFSHLTGLYEYHLASWFMCQTQHLICFLMHSLTFNVWFTDYAGFGQLQKLYFGQFYCPNTSCGHAQIWSYKPNTWGKYAWEKWAPILHSAFLYSVSLFLSFISSRAAATVDF